MISSIPIKLLTPLCKFLEDINKGVWFYKVPVLQPKYLLKKNIYSEKKFNGHAKILITQTLYRRTTTEAYLEPNRTSTMELFYKKKPSAFL